MSLRGPGMKIAETHFPLTDSANQWLMRSYSSAEQWKTTGRNTFNSLRGNSESARENLAARIQQYFNDGFLVAEQVSRWKRDYSGIETVTVFPPALASNSPVDWRYLADYVLLCCAPQYKSIYFTP